MIRGLVRNLAFSAIFILVLALAAQASFEVDFPDNISVIRGETAELSIRITNNQEFEDSFRFSTDSVDWKVTSEPLSDFFSGVQIEPNGRTKVRLLLNSRGLLEFGRHGLDLTLQSEKGQVKKEISLTIDVRSKDQPISEYSAAVKGSVRMVPRTINPSENVTVFVDLINRNPRNLENLTIKLSSNNLNGEITASLKPLEEKTVEKTFSINDASKPPQEDSLKVELFYRDNPLKPVIEEDFEIGKFPKTIPIVTEEKEFMKKIFRITYTNTGNAPDLIILPQLLDSKKGEWDIEKRDAERVRTGMFLRTDFEPGSEIDLNPGVSRTFVITTNHRIFLTIPVLVLIIIGIIVIHYLMRSPIRVRKSAKVTRVRDHGISSFKIFVHIKNASKRTYENITVTDTLATPARLLSDSSPAVIKPNSIYHDGQKSIVKWKIKRLDPLEERVLTYQANIKIAIVGDIILPSVNVKYHTKKGLKILAKSKKTKLSSNSLKRKVQ